MKADNETTRIYLKDYAPPVYITPEVHLTFYLDDQCTRVVSELLVVPHKLHRNLPDLELAGINLKLHQVTIDGTQLREIQGDYQLHAKGLTISGTVLDQLVTKNLPLKVITEVTLSPATNYSLSGLYQSQGILCTQNEPEGMRRITYFIDRPDNMAKYEVTLVGDKKKYPYLLSNGNLISQKDLPNGLHQVVWRDPFNKPCYLFAVVAGDFAVTRDIFTTKSGRIINIEFYTEKGSETLCRHALNSLKKAMKFDETYFGLEYDLDLFMVVAVNAFNGGAMENKGLNIFNAKLILADPQVATDRDYFAVESVIAHEYFHNWSGNRVTCRDWFQLTLKEGLTVFRDQLFSEHQGYGATLRIEQVERLKITQFPEDQSAQAHSIRPESFVEIENFYTATVYEKGAEVIRMLFTLLGQETFLAGLQFYFKQFDGLAVTCEDFIYAMEQVSEKDLSQFMNWYRAFGTPEIYLKRTPEGAVIQQTIKTAAKEFLPLLIPLRVKIGDGREQLLILNQLETAIALKENESVSLNLGFSAPVICHNPLKFDEKLHLIENASDHVFQHELISEIWLSLWSDCINGKDPERQLLNFFSTLQKLILQHQDDPKLQGFYLQMPAAEKLFMGMAAINFTKVRSAYLNLMNRTGIFFYSLAENLLNECEKKITSPYQYHPQQVGLRYLQLVSLKLLVAAKPSEVETLLANRIERYSNQTFFSGATEMMNQFCPQDPFFLKTKERYLPVAIQHNLRFMHYLNVVAGSYAPDTLVRIHEMEQHPSFDYKVPNFARALYGKFTSNHASFHTEKGIESHLKFILKLDSVNPQIAGNLCQGFKYFHQYEPSLSAFTRNLFEKSLKSEVTLSNNVKEMLQNTLKS